jgi:hypothetical protein
MVEAMIEYIGIGIETIPRDFGEIVKFKMVFLNSTKNALFSITKSVSSYAITNPTFLTGEYVAASIGTALRKYCKKRDQELTPAQRDAIYKVIVDRVDKCAQAYREGNKTFKIKEIDK